MTREGFPELLERLSLLAHGQGNILELSLPPDQSERIALLHAKGRIFESEWTEDGCFEAVVSVPPEWREQFLPFCRKEE